MIIRALCDYYDILAQETPPKVPLFGFAEDTANYCAVLNTSGELVSVLSLLQEKKPKRILTPKTMKSSSIAASPVFDAVEYVFGISGKKEDGQVFSPKFEAAKKLHLDMFSVAGSEEAVAIVRFFEQWDIQKAWENEAILQAYDGKNLSGRVIFRLVGKDTYFHEVPEIIGLWQQRNEENRGKEGDIISQCCITGTQKPIARLHTQLKGIKGASTTGASLVSYKQDAYCSYGLSQSYNSAVSEEAMFKYTTILQNMISSAAQKLYIGEDTVVFWAHCHSQKPNELFSLFLSGVEEGAEGEEKEDKQAMEQVRTVLEQGKKGIPTDVDFDADTQFCVLSLSPNAGRVSVRYFYKDTFGEFCNKIKQHYEDIDIYSSNGRKYLKIGSLLYATINPKSTDKKINPLLGGAVMRAILNEQPYPAILYNQVLIRTKTEANITQARAAIIKGYLLRRNRLFNKKEDITVALNEASTNQAYVLGRIFAILERIQQEALGQGINATIKDKFFATACTNPAMVFPRLLKLAGYHLAKIEGNYFEIELGKCMNLLPDEGFPKSQNSEKQGRFILGYYQQVQKFYTKKENIVEEKKNEA